MYSLKVKSGSLHSDSRSKTIGRWKSSFNNNQLVFVRSRHTVGPLRPGPGFDAVETAVINPLVLI